MDSQVKTNGLNYNNQGVDVGNGVDMFNNGVNVQGMPVNVQATSIQPNGSTVMQTNGNLDSSLQRSGTLVPVEQNSRTCTNKTFSPWGLLFKSIIPDFAGLKWWQWCFLGVFAAILIVFSFIDLNYWIDPANTPSWKTWENLAGQSTWAQVFYYLSGVSSFTGSLCVFMAARGKYSNFFWGIINTVCYGLFAFSVGYAGDAQLNIIFFLPMNILGLYLWYNSMMNDTSNDESATAQSKSLKLWQWLMFVVLAAGVAAFFYWEILWFSVALTGEYYFADQPVPRALDAVSTSISIFAQILMLMQFWENWLLWIVTNIIAIVRYSGIGGSLNINVLIMWIFYLLNSLYGTYDWYTRYKKELKENPKLAKEPIKV